MPNEHNVDAPLTLITVGRTGSSLLSAVFARHPEFSVAGETVNLIFDAWHAVEASTGVVSPLVENGRWVPLEERAGRVVRSAMLTACADERPRWFQKPIGVPATITRTVTEDSWTEAAAAYWTVMRHAFPRGRCFTVLRHPCDVVLSARAYWGYGESTLWWGMALMARILLHEDSPVTYAVSYDGLAHDGRAEVERLFAHLEVPFDDAVLGAFEQVHAAAKGRERLTPETISRRTEWQQLAGAKLSPAHRRWIDALFRRFGREIEWPDHLRSRRVARGARRRAAAGRRRPERLTTTALKRTIKQLNQRIAALHIAHCRALEELNREHHGVWYEQRRWIEELERGKAWLNEERQRQRAWIAELDGARAWLNEERQLLLRQAEEQAEIIRQKENAIASLSRRLAWLEGRAASARGACAAHPERPGGGGAGDGAAVAGHGNGSRP